jgi:hypothetical protein
MSKLGFDCEQEVDLAFNKGMVLEALQYCSRDYCRVSQRLELNDGGTRCCAAYPVG